MRRVIPQSFIERPAPPTVASAVARGYALRRGIRYRILITQADTMSALKTVAVENTAQAFLEMLEALGVRYLIGNAGTDFASIIDGFSKRAVDGKARPRALIVAHECCAVSMAHGYYLVTGEPAVAMVHTTPGTANALGALMNAFRSNVPLVLCAGRTPLSEGGMPGSRDTLIHWGQESFDQGSMVREFVKWDYELRNFAQLEAVMRRAFAVAMAEPRGPVYLSLPREVLAEAHSEFNYSPKSIELPVMPPAPSPQALTAMARLIAVAERPLVITRMLGRNSAAVASLVELAESFALPVVEHPNPAYVNFPNNHPLHLGYDPAPYLDEADLIVVIDTDVPWIPHLRNPGAGAKVVHLGVNPIYDRYPIWGFPSDLAVQADSAVALPMLTEVLAPMRTAHQAAIERRAARIAERHRHLIAAAQAEIEAAAGRQHLTLEWIAHCLDRVRDKRMVFINEYDLSLRHITLDHPGTQFGHSTAGYLGWGVGAALGVKLGAPDKTVVAIVGDGSYIFSVPSACHLASAALGLPTLTIIANNGGWGAVHRAVQGVHPEGWSMRTGEMPFVRFGMQPAYEMFAQAYGGHGEAVSDPKELPAALERALHVVREERRQAVLNIICRPL
jgi:acetolactate synthase-1/2/3 large subunit